jgi:hypothetical protein
MSEVREAGNEPGIGSALTPAAVVSAPVSPPLPAGWSGATTSQRRQSMPFFHNANYATIVEALPTCVPAGDEPRYEPVMAGPHLAGKTTRSVADRPGG